MNDKSQKPRAPGKSDGKLPESQEPDGGRGAPQPATSDDKARAEDIVKKQRQHHKEPDA